MDWKGFVVGLALGISLLLLLGARKAPEAAETASAAAGRGDVGRFELTADKTAQGKDRWVIFDTQNGVARIYRDDAVHEVSFKENAIRQVK